MRPPDVLVGVTGRVAVGVRPAGIQPQPRLPEVGQPVAVAVLDRVAEPVAVGVDLARVRPEPHLDAVPEAVVVGDLTVIDVIALAKRLRDEGTTLAGSELAKQRGEAFDRRSGGAVRERHRAQVEPVPGEHPP